LVLDNKGKPHVGYITREDIEDRIWSGNLFYSVLEEGQWKKEKVEENIIRPEGGNVLIDSNGTPKIIYKKDIKDEYDYHYKSLMRAYLKNGVWDTKSIQSEEVWDWGSAVMDENDQIHVVYEYYGYESSEYGRYRWYGINYVQGQKNEWREEVVKDTAKVEGDLEKSIEGIDLVIDNEGKTHIVYLLKDSSDEEDVYILEHLREK